MKILFVCEHLPNEGGIGPALLNQINALDRQKHRVYLCLIGNYIDPAVVIPEGVILVPGSKRMEYHIVNYAKRKREYPLWERAAMLVMKKLRRMMGFVKYQEFALKHFRIKERFDVAIAYSNDICRDGVPISGGSNYCVKHCVSADKKIAWIHNEVEKQGFTHEYCINNFADYDQVVNVSSGCKKLFDDMAPELIERSCVVYNTIDYDRIHRLLQEPAPTDMDADSFTILTAARIEEGQKKISRILCCADALRSSGRSFKWYVLGTGPDYERFTRQTEELDLQGHVIFLGYRTNPFVYMKRADVFVLPSLYESFGLVLKEAFAAGCPVITTNFEASQEIVDNGINGIICSNSAEGIQQAIETCMDDPQQLCGFRQAISEENGNLNQIAKDQFDALINR